MKLCERSELSVPQNHDPYHTVPQFYCRGWLEVELARGGVTGSPGSSFQCFCQNPRELQNPVFVVPDFELEVDFWSVFGHFWWFLEVAWLPFYGFI